MLSDEEIETITFALKHYHLVDYQLITDYTKVIQNREVLTVDVNGENKTLYKYECPLQTIYLDMNNYPYTYEKQYVVNDEYYYDFNNENIEGTSGTLTYINNTEWKRTTETEDWMYINNRE